MRLGRPSVEGHRRRPDGVDLTWRQIGVNALLDDPALPFFIQWTVGPELHPSADAKAVATIVGCEVAGDPDKIHSWIGGDFETPIEGSDVHWVEADDPGLVVSHPFAKVKLERCITAPLHIAADAEVSLNECVVDATAQHLVAYRSSASEPLVAGGALTLESCTVIGKVHTQQLTLASDCIFIATLSSGDTWKAPLWADRRQQGCVRFSYVPPESRTPRRFHCQPEAGDQETRPHFTSLRYGDPGYCQLRQYTPDKIRRGAHDESEMGVLHGLYQPQREINLRVRMDEYLRFGLEAGLIYGS